MPIFDLRSDTVTTPSVDMRRAMASAEVGDDVLDGDPTTGQLEQETAEILGHEAGLFFCSGTQANQTAVAVHTRPGFEVLVEADAHLVHHEQSGAAAISGVQFRPIVAPRGVLTANLVREALRPADHFYPAPKLLTVENTHSRAGGSVTDESTLIALRALATEISVGFHIDGARLWNGAVALGVAPDQLARHGDTVMVSFSKGLGSPVGSCLVGSRDVIREAKRVRQRLGGAMRQSGVLAAACLYGLRNNMSRLGEDHAKATELFQGLQGVNGIHVDEPQTNFVMIDLEHRDAKDAARTCQTGGVLLSVYGVRRLRAVTHLDISMDEVRTAAAVMRRVFEGEV